MSWEAPPQTYLSGNTAGTTHVFGPVVTLRGGANVTVSGSGNQIVIVGGAGGGGSGPSLSAGTQSTDGGTVVFSNSNNVTFGMSGSSRITASASFPAATAFVLSASNGLAWGTNGSTVTGSYTVPSQSVQPAINLAAGTQTATSGTVKFVDSNGIVFGMSASTRITASYTVPTQSVQPGIQTIHAGLADITNGAFTFADGNGITFGADSDLSQLTASVQTAYRGATDAVGLNTAKSNVTWTVNSSGISLDARGYAGTATAVTNAAITVNSGGVSVSVAAQSAVAGHALGVSNTGNTLGNTGTGSTGTVVFAASGGLTASQSTGAGISTVWYSVGPYITTARGSTDAIGLNTAQTNVTWTANSSGLSLNAGGYAGTVTGATNCSVTANTSGVSVNVGGATLSAYEPYLLITSTGYSSHAPASWEFIPWVQPTPIAIKNLIVHVSLNASVPAATSAASTGTERISYKYGATIFTRQNYGAQSTNLSAITTASMGLTAGLSYSSTSQSFVMSWVTDSTGGTTSFNTTTNAGNWSSYATGPKFLSIPLVTTLTEGEYWIAFQHSSTTGTTNSNVTLLSFSKLQQQWPVVTVGSLGGNATLASSGAAGMGIGVASAVTTNNTMAGNVISASVQPLIYFVMSNV